MDRKLDELGVDRLDTDNPYCSRVVLMGTPREAEVILTFWRGEPESLEFMRDRFPLKMLPRLRRALQRAAEVIEEFPT
ncbi:MAG: hypothetical protein PVJ27_11405 [Candidatus Brocadiaceae bacterium]